MFCANLATIPLHSAQEKYVDTGDHFNLRVQQDGGRECCDTDDLRR